MEPIEFGQDANSYAKSKGDIPVYLMDSLMIRNINFAGKKVAVLGAGTGALTRKIALRNADVIGVEPSEELLEQAKILNRMKNFSIPYLQRNADDTGLPASEYDFVTVIWEWHGFNREKAILEVKRILKANGALIVIDTGFQTGSVAVEKTFGVLEKYVGGSLQPTESNTETRQSINGFPVEWFEEWTRNGFELRDFYRMNYTVSFTKLEWVGRVDSILWLGGFDESERKMVLEEIYRALPEQDSYVVPHECNVCILRLVE